MLPVNSFLTHFCVRIIWPSPGWSNRRDFVWCFNRNKIFCLSPVPNVRICWDVTVAYNPWKELRRAVRPIFTVCHAWPCAPCGILFFLSYPLPWLLRSLQTGELVCSLKPLIASTECESKAIKIMPELGCKVSVPWICPQEKHLCLFLALLGFLFLMLNP